MSSEWPVVTVDSVCDLIVDCVNKTAPVAAEKTSFRMIRTTNVRNGHINLSDCKYVTEEIFEKWTRRAKLEIGDVILTREAPIGEVGLVENAAGIFLGQRLMQYRANPVLLDNKFLLYAFLSPALQHQFGSHEGSGSVVSHIRVGDCYKFRIPLPSLERQKEISSILGALDDRVTILRETNKTLESIAQAIFKSWFVDFDPVRAKMEGRQPEGMDEETAAMFPDSLEENSFGIAPRGWQTKGLDDIALYLNGLALQKFPATGNNDLPIIKIAQLRKGETDKNLLAAGNIKSDYIVRDGDILFSWSGSLEVEIWSGGEGALNQHLFKVTSAQYPKWFYYLWTKHHLPSFRHIAESKATTMGHIQRKHLSDAKAIIPCPKVLQQANKILGPLLDSRISNALRVRTLTALRDALLPRLISGQLRLPEAQEQVENALS